MNKDFEEYCATVSEAELLKDIALMVNNTAKLSIYTEEDKLDVLKKVTKKYLPHNWEPPTIKHNLPSKNRARSGSGTNYHKDVQDILNSSEFDIDLDNIIKGNVTAREIADKYNLGYSTVYNHCKSKKERAKKMTPSI